MEKLSNNIAAKIGKELNFDNDKKEILAYGTFAIFHSLLSIILVVILGFIFHTVVEALIISFTISILRKYSGGAHANSPAKCAIIGTIVCVGIALLVQAVIPKVNTKLLFFLGVSIFTWSFYLVYKLAPLDSVAKPIKNKEKRKRMKKGSIIVLSIYLIVVCFDAILFLYNRDTRLISYYLCIHGGILWQVFTLTSPGHLLLHKIDALLERISNFGRRV